MGGMPGGPGYSQQVLMAQQNANMEMLEVRRRDQRAEMATRGGPPGAVPGARVPPPGAGVSHVVLYVYIGLITCNFL